MHSRPRRRADRPADPYFYVRIRGRRERLATNYRDSVVMMEELSAANLHPTPGVAAAKESVSGLVEKFRLHLLAERGVAESTPHISKTITRLRLVLDHMGAVELGDLSRDGLNAFLVDLRSGEATGRACASKTFGTLQPSGPNPPSPMGLRFLESDPTSARLARNQPTESISATRIRVRTT